MSKILFHDLNNLMVRNFFSSEIQAGTNPQYNLWKYQIFTQIYWNVVNFEVDEVILAVDGRHSWRKSYFPRYKAQRSKQKREDIDWEALYAEYHKFCEEIKNHIPFKIIQIDKAEADDIIGVLAKYINKESVVVSNDEDFLQLSDHRVKVYNPNKKDFLELKENKEYFINRLCLKGQSKDNIFNVNTPSDYPDELKKPGIGDKKVDKIMESGLNNFLDTEQNIKKTYTDNDGNEQIYQKSFKPRENYHRNWVLLDFDKIPNIVQNKIKEKYDFYKLPDPENIYKFFKSKGWNGYLDQYDIVERTLLNLY